MTSAIKCVFILVILLESQYVFSSPLDFFESKSMDALKKLSASKVKPDYPYNPKQVLTYKSEQPSTIVQTPTPTKALPDVLVTSEKKAVESFVPSVSFQPLQVFTHENNQNKIKLSEVQTVTSDRFDTPKINIESVNFHDSTPVIHNAPLSVQSHTITSFDPMRNTQHPEQSTFIQPVQVSTQFTSTNQFPQVPIQNMQSHQINVAQNPMTQTQFVPVMVENQISMRPQTGVTNQFGMANGVSMQNNLGQTVFMQNQIPQTFVSNQFGTNNMGINQFGTNNMGINQFGTNNMGINQFGTNNMGINQLGISHMSPMGMNQMNTMGMNQMSPLGMGQFGMNQMGMGQQRMNQIGFGQTGFMPNQMNLGMRTPMSPMVSNGFGANNMMGMSNGSPQMSTGLQKLLMG